MKIKYFTFTLLLSFSLITFLSCDQEMPDDHSHTATDFGYHAHIHPPGVNHVHMGEDLHLDVLFESHTGETIHHINIQVYHKASGTLVYDQPDPAHIHATEGKYEFKDDLALSSENGFGETGTWVIAAKVWGPEAGDGEVREEMEFEVE